MSFFEFPHTRTYDSDLGYIIKRVDELNATYEMISRNLQIHIMGDIDYTQSYRLLSLVYDPDTQLYYIAIQDVPAGTALTDTAYWMPFNYSTTDISDLLNRVTSLENRMTIMTNYVNRLRNKVSEHKDTMIVIGHRGCGFAPENTLEAIETAAMLGYKYVEVDVNYTLDQVPVCLHDDTIDRTSNGAGNIHEMNYATAVGYNYNYNSTWFSNCRIPTILEALGLCKELGLHCELDIASRGLPVSIIQSVYSEVCRLGMQSMVQFACGASDYQTFRPYLGYSPISVYCTSDMQVDAAKEYFSNLENEFVVSLNDDAVLIDYCMQQQIPAKVWTVNTSSRVWSLFKEKSVVMVTTDTAAPFNRSKDVPVIKPYSGRITITNQNTFAVPGMGSFCTALLHVEEDLDANKTTVATIQPPLGSYGAQYNTYGIAFLNSGGTVRNIGVMAAEQTNMLNLKHEQTIPTGSYINVFLIITYASDYGLFT